MLAGRPPVVTDPRIVPREDERQQQAEREPPPEQPRKEIRKGQCRADPASDAQHEPGTGYIGDEHDADAANAPAVQRNVAKKPAIADTSA
jgi:hypothetical protein